MLLNFRRRVSLIFCLILFNMASYWGLSGHSWLYFVDDHGTLVQHDLTLRMIRALLFNMTPLWGYHGTLVQHGFTLGVSGHSCSAWLHFGDIKSLLFNMASVWGYQGTLVQNDFTLGMIRVLSFTSRLFINTYQLWKHDQ